MPIKTNNLVACPECDALQREVDLDPGGAASCVRCGAELYREKAHSLDRTLAFICAATVVFIAANAFPLMELETQGIQTSSTLFGTVTVLQETGWPTIALLVFLTTIAVPFLQLAAALYILVPLKLGFVPARLPLAVRSLDAIWPWGMVEVFLLGAMVSQVKLAQIATLYPGAAMYMLGAYVLLIVAAVAAFEPRVLWERVESLRAGAGQRLEPQP
ncbi:MAG: paraquat-inducible protein A [Pseudomonadota bacterium]|nr:paraquat-inducible protein A [Pseudomonadota bacterium]